MKKRGKNKQRRMRQPWFRLNLLAFGITAVAVLGLGVAYAVLNTTLNISGSAQIVESSGVFVSKVELNTAQTACGYTSYDPTWNDNQVTMDGMMTQTNCEMTFNITITNNTNELTLLSEIIEDAFNNSSNMQYDFSITPNTVAAFIQPNDQLTFSVTFSFKPNLGGQPSQMDFSATFHFIYDRANPPVITVSNSSRNFEIFRGNNSFNLDARLSALDDIDGNITSQIIKTCENSSGQSVSCPASWQQLPRGDYVFIYDVTNSFGLQAETVRLNVTLWDFIKIDSGTYHTVAVGSNGSLYTWGYNAGYRQGLGDTTRRPSPVKMNLSSANIIDAAACENSGHAIDASGNLYSWGTGGSYALGTNSTATQQTPYLIAPPNNEKYTQVSCFYASSAALTDAGNVYAWGWSAYGGNGGGNATDIRVPTLLSGLSNIVYVDMGYYNGGAIDANGDLYLWGTNGEGQLGVGSAGAVSSLGVTAYYNKPAKYNNITNAKVLCFGVYHAVLIKNDGTVITWGNNAYGRVANGTASTNAYSPYTTGITNGVSCAADRYGSAVSTADGLGYFAGGNNYGELGQGFTSTNITTFTATAKTNITRVALQLDSGHELADGITTWGFGYNGNGELGIGTTSSTPTVTAWALAAPAVLEW